MATKSSLKAAGIDLTELTEREREALSVLAGAGPITTAALAAIMDAPLAVPVPSELFETRFVMTLVRRLHRDFERMRGAGVQPESLGDPDQLAERVAAAAPLEPSPLDELTGPFYDTAALRKWLDTSRQALADRVKAHTLLGLQTGGGTWVYPAWQFTNDRKTIPHLADVLRALASGTDERWTWALWLTAPNEDWGETAAWEWLAAGRDPEPVLTEAHADAARWVA